MACLNERFIIDRGLDNEFILQFKEDGELTPLILEDSDTFELNLYLLENEDISTPNLTIDSTDSSDGVITIEDKPNGRIKLLIKESATEALVAEKGDKSDRYYLKPTYRGVIDASTTNGGNIIVPIELIYVR